MSLKMLGGFTNMMRHLTNFHHWERNSESRFLKATPAGVLEEKQSLPAIGFAAAMACLRLLFHSVTTIVVLYRMLGCARL